jgi:hypothetical protein
MTKNQGWALGCVIFYFLVMLIGRSGALIATLFTLFYIPLIIYCFVFFNADEAKQLRMAHGPINKQIECQLCHHVGLVHVHKGAEKQGISGGKATGAILTGGMSLLATGLSRTGEVVICWCGNCKMQFKLR